MRGDEDHARGQDRVQLNVAATGGTARSSPCPSCAHPITIAEFDVDLGEIFACPECGTEYPRPLLALNLGPVRYERCPACRKFHLVRII